MRRSESSLILLQATRDSSALMDQFDGPTVYFDGSCPLCTYEINHYASCRGGNRLNFIDVSKDDAVLGSNLVSADAMRRFHVRLSNGDLVSGARAFLVVWASLPGWRWLSNVARVPGVPHFLELVYLLFLPLRPALSKLAARFGARPANSGKSGR